MFTLGVINNINYLRTIELRSEKTEESCLARVGESVQQLSEPAWLLDDQLDR
jgi:hypothetical protein